ncbi:MAG: PstS family phosphate ABC transporter substrate-binding protein [Pseudomonadota bacterium]|nr:PstS family phosphate ABC transporter substrate-binding protein [Candidatus Acidoferrales bacterium]
MQKKIGHLALAAATMLAAPLAVQARDYISIVGSSTVYPFSTVVAEQFGKSGQFKTPKVESTGTGGGFKLFCGGVGVQHPDISNASRAIKSSEKEDCAKNGVKDIVEVKIGYDGIVLANSKASKPLEIDLKHLYLALAKNVPDPKSGDKLVPNPYKMWSDIDASLPKQKIEVLGPPPTSGTRDALVELGMEGGCKGFPLLKEMKEKDEKAFKAACGTMREDGAFIEAGENDNLIVQKLTANKDAYGIFGYSFLEENLATVKPAIINGSRPTYESISGGAYPLSRPLFFYVKKAHVGVIPGIAEFVAEFTSEKAFGPEGYLADRGLIALPDDERKKVADAAKKMATLK